MTKVTDTSAVISSEHAQAINLMKEQLLIVFLKRLGGSISIPAAEIDNTQDDLFSFRVGEANVFHFSLSKKQ